LLLWQGARAESREWPLGDLGDGRLADSDDIEGEKEVSDLSHELGEHLLESRRVDASKQSFGDVEEEAKQADDPCVEPLPDCVSIQSDLINSNSRGTTLLEIGFGGDEVSEVLVDCVLNDCVHLAVEAVEQLRVRDE
jgi:hypothetical protein